MMLARSTLGSGVTSTTKPSSATSEQPTRTARGAPSMRHSPKTRVTTTAQFAPETAVR